MGVILTPEHEEEQTYIPIVEPVTIPGPAPAPEKEIPVEPEKTPVPEKEPEKVPA
jgi:hypothetical protein